MPILKVSGGWKWGEGDAVHKTRQGAVNEAQAAYASGFGKSSSHDGTKSQNTKGSNKRKKDKKKPPKRIKSRSALRRLI